MVEFAAVVVAVAFVVLVGYLIPTILQLKRTVAQSERLLTRVNNELPLLLKDLRGTSENLRDLTDQARVGVERATVFFHAIGDVGQTVQHVHSAVRGRGGAVLLGLTSVLAGLKAASHTMKQRVHHHKEGGNTHGK